jgi:hypothetical protein
MSDLYSFIGFFSIFDQPHKINQKTRKPVIMPLSSTMVVGGPLGGKVDPEDE